MNSRRRVLFILIYCLIAYSAMGQQREPAKTTEAVKLPRYMTDMLQPIPDELKLSDAPRTSREVSCFRSFDGIATMLDVVRRCGIPDEHQGSGIYIFIYKLADGSVVAVGTADLRSLMYVDHLQKNGSTHLLRSAQKSPPSK